MKDLEHWHTYESVFSTVCFNATSEGPFISTLRVAANLHASENYPAARIVLAVAALFELGMTPDQSRALRAQLELAERDVVAAVPSLKPQPVTPAAPMPVPVLWLDHKGCGPDEMALEVSDHPAELDGRIPAWLGLQVRAAGPVIVGSPLVDGGFMLHREQVSDLHRQFGEWLTANPVTPSVKP